jgi:hypothetical protein
MMRIGPCMCGDLCCGSCGPAQGNYRCPICKAWRSEGCKHFDLDDKLEKEFEEEARKVEEAERLADDEYAKELEEEKRLVEDWKNGTA